MPLDDISHVQGNPKQLAKLVTFRLAANGPKEKAGQYIRASNLAHGEWRVIPLSTSEDPLWAQIESKKGRAHQVRGEEVRMINVRACISSRDDIFDGQRADSRVGKTTGERAKYVERRERYALKYQGAPYRAYLDARVRDGSTDKRLNEYIADLIAECLIPEQHRWLARIRRLLAVIYASAALAIDYRILPWGKKATLRDIKACMNDAIQQLTAHIATTVASGSSGRPDGGLVFADFKRRLDGASFVTIEPGRRRS